MSLTPAYTCKLCRRALTLPPGQIIGEKPEEHQSRVAKMLSEHMGTEHAKEYGFAFMTGNALTGLVICQHFQHNDEKLSAYVQQNATGVRRFTSMFLGRWRVTDQMIERIVEGELRNLSADQPVLAREVIINMLKSMRDQVDEAPEQPSSLVA